MDKVKTGIIGAVLTGQKECEEMPHSKIIKMMKVMEDIHMDIKKQI